MHLTPPEIQYQPLKRRRRSYDRADVDRLLERVTVSYEHVWRERDELRARVAELENEVGSLRDLEGELKDALVTAHHTANKILADAKQEAERLVLEARVQTAAAAAQELEDLRAEIERLHALERDVYANLRARLEQASTSIGDGQPAEEPAASEELAEALRPKPESAGVDDRDD
jgi:cell division septum initiation protein DivIVA